MWILASFVISSVFYVVLYGTGAGLIKGPFCLNLDTVLLFVSLSVVLSVCYRVLCFHFFCLFCFVVCLYMLIVFSASVCCLVCSSLLGKGVGGYLFQFYGLFLPVSVICSLQL